MELINNTFLAAGVGVGELPGSTRRMGILAAKATFNILSNGRCAPDLDNPYPIFKEDEPTPLGLLPRDDFPKMDNLDVIVLGNAYSEEGKPASRVDVSLRIGPVKRSLVVFGDRSWQDGKITEPLPFTRMPLTYSNAFGGKVQVEIDHDSYVTLADPRNQEGKGYSVLPMIPGIESMLKPPEDFPKFNHIRLLPNIEDPAHLITSFNDSPDPAYWAAVPLATAVHAFRTMGIKPDDLNSPDQVMKKPDIGPNASVFHRAHPSLDLDIELSPGMKIMLTGLTPKGPLQFEVPGLEVRGEILVDNKKAEVQFRPDTLVILPEEKRFYIVYRFNFTYEYIPGTERSVRFTVREI